MYKLIAQKKNSDMFSLVEMVDRITFIFNMNMNMINNNETRNQIYRPMFSSTTISKGKK